MAKRLGAFSLEPFYDEVLAELGAPPLGVPDELTFEYAWDLAEQKIAAENRAAAAQAKKAVGKKAGDVSVVIGPAKAPAKSTTSKSALATQLDERLDEEFGA